MNEKKLVLIKTALQLFYSKGLILLVLMKY